MWGVSTYYDVLDIIATGAGSLLTILTYELIVLKRKATAPPAPRGSTTPFGTRQRD
jgi:hypothetical protein